MSYKWGIVDEHRKLLYVTAIIDATHFRGVWHGEQFEVRCLPDSGSVIVGDLVFTHVLPGNSELVAVFPPPKGIIYYSRPKVAEGGGLRAQCELWSYDDVTGLHTLLWTSTYAWTEGQAHITMMAWVPEVNLLYFNVNSVNWDVSADEQNELFKYDPTTGIVTSVTTGFGTYGVAPDRSAPPLYDAAYFQGDLYLAQGGDAWGPLAAAVYKLTIPGEVLTLQYSHPTVDWGINRPSIAVWGDDAELLFCVYHNVIATGNIYSSIDGTVWNLLAALGNNFEMLHMMTDRNDGKVYIVVLNRLAGTGHVYVYDGVAVVLDRNHTLTEDAYPMGARYTGIIRQDIWLFDPNNNVGNDCEFKDGAWAGEDMAVTFFINGGIEGGGQFTAGCWSKIFYYVYDAGNTIKLYQRVAGVWGTLLSYSSVGMWNNNYDCDFCMTLGKTAILPHEQ